MYIFSKTPFFLSSLCLIGFQYIQCLLYKKGGLKPSFFIVKPYIHYDLRVFLMFRGDCLHFFGGITVLVGFPILHLIILDTVQCFHLTVWIYLC